MRGGYRDKDNMIIANREVGQDSNSRLSGADFALVKNHYNIHKSA